MQTIHELCAELNRWLAFRWQTAAHGYELPTESALVTYAEQLLHKAEGKSVGTDALSRIYTNRAKDGLPETHAGLAVLCALSFKTTPDSDGVDNKRVLRIVTTLSGPSEATLVVLPLTLASVADNDKGIIAVKSVKAPEDDINISDLFVDACRIQDSVETTIVERWLSQNREFRKKHLICPACGAMLYDVSEDRHLYCSYCDWSSRCQYDYADEFADEEAFRCECDLLLKSKAFDEKRDAVLAQINEGIDALAALYEKPVKGYDTRAVLESEIGKISVKLAKLTGKPI